MVWLLPEIAALGECSELAASEVPVEEVSGLPV